MPVTIPQLTFQAKFAYALIILIGLGYLLNIGQGIICPLLIAMLFAILLRPVASFFRNKLRFPNALSCIVTVLLFTMLFVGIFYCLRS